MASYMPCGLQQETVHVLQNDITYFQLSSLRIAFCNIPPKIFPLWAIKQKNSGAAQKQTSVSEKDFFHFLF
jgi:hypothetical protein